MIIRELDRNKLNKKRKRDDAIKNGITYFASSLGVLILLSIFMFILVRGSKLISWDLLTGDYWSQNYYISIVDEYNKRGEYKRPEGLSEEVYWSEKWGIGVVDYLNHEKERLVLLEYVAEDSPFNNVLNANTGPDNGTAIELKTGLQLEKIEFYNAKGVKRSTGSMVGNDAQTVVKNLDNSAVTIAKGYVKTAGGGIRGSIISTLILIAISLVIAMPIGISSAIYLFEYAPRNRVTRVLRSSIETLAGVPSIIYGLMGVTVLYPITTYVGATGTSILLGGLTLSIILLPTIIRSTEEALIVVPDGLRSASLSLGANKSQTIFKIVLPSAVPGILTAVLLSLGRIIGESAALIYTMGTFINDKPTLLSGGTSLAVHIWSVMSGEQPNFELASAISLVILAIVLILNIATKLLSRRLNRSWY